ncbi:DUF4145 domain-containing protein [Leptospira stimsonii]|uniref:DUF4145 domain-containing protein n=1 Tax=Leptospira stimsonii TaxID=2202203 RepID=A0ABY2N505_9LEPT|nr:DUF4145 domain-containing protein [Leptospira stimsonii]TGK24956.1 DUF4145 domain-containing protein [Leptospira stimsonii]TGM17176.1 DUF4145 domain-containing protein [Leptospira stimsonii]
MKYILPAVNLKSFTCYHCGVLAKQDWVHRRWSGFEDSYNKSSNEIRISTCDHRGKHALWVLEENCFPGTGDTRPPNPAMPDSVLKIYTEASSISGKSPRGAAALLRLSIQVLCKELGESGKNINEDIASLVKKGLPELVQQSLDIVRVIGNDAVHPGQIDTDDEKTVSMLFDLINIIIEYMIALPNKIGGIYSSLPADKLDGIKKRDKK